MNRTAALVLAAGIVTCAPAFAAEIALAPHKAVYDLSLISSRGPQEIQSARGRIAYNFGVDACGGYALDFRQVTVLSTSEQGERLSDLRSTTYESADGKAFRFKSEMRNGSGAPVVVDGASVPLADGIGIRLTKPQRGSVTLPAGVNFPTAHTRRILAAAMDGQTTLNVPAYDGSDDGQKVYDTFVVIGHAAEKPAGDAAGKGPLSGMRRWPVSVSYYTAGGEGERTPLYTLGFDLYENGVSGALKLQYGDFSLKGDLVKLDLDNPSTGPSADCKK